MITLLANYIHGRTPPFSYSHGTLPCDCVHFKGAISSKKPEGRSPTGNLIPYSFTDVRAGFYRKWCCHECNSCAKISNLSSNAKVLALILKINE